MKPTSAYITAGQSIQIPQGYSLQNWGHFVDLGPLFQILYHETRNNSLREAIIKKKDFCVKVS